MTPEQADRYIGNAWVKDGNGPDEWNCWNLLRHLLRHYFHKDIPKVGLESEDELRALYKERLDSGSWIIRDEPKHGYGVLLKGGLSPHVGLYLDIDGGGVIHALEGFGVVFTERGALRLMGYGNTKFYEIVK